MQNQIILLGQPASRWFKRAIPLEGIIPDLLVNSRNQEKTFLLGLTKVPKCFYDPWRKISLPRKNTFLLGVSPLKP
jgi:hypothetical protein